jgi:hypothetical protein
MRNNQPLCTKEHRDSQVGHGDIQDDDAIHTKIGNYLGRTEYSVRRFFPACWEAYKINQRHFFFNNSGVSKWFYDTNVLRKKFVTDAILLIENIYLISQTERTIHLKIPIPESTTRLTEKETCKIKAVLRELSIWTLPWYHKHYKSRKRLCLKKRKGIFSICSHTCPKAALRLVLPKEPNRTAVTSPWPEKGNTSSFRNVVVFRILDDGHSPTPNNPECYTPSSESFRIYLIQFCHVSQWLKTGFGLVIGFINNLQVVTRNYSYTIAVLHNFQSLHNNLSQFPLVFMDL